MQPEIAVVSVPLASLIPYAANARTHSEAQVAQIAASIAEFGFVNPVLVDAAGVLVAGHGRVLAAKRLGLASVPAIRLAHLTEAQARALRLADNQIALNSGWDEALLAAELARIRDEGVVDLDVLGFSGLELDQLLAAADGGDDAALDEAPPPPEVADHLAPSDHLCPASATGCHPVADHLSNFTPCHLSACACRRMPQFLAGSL